MNNEKRKHPRYPLDVKVNSIQYGFATSKDLSEGGICLIAEEPFEVGSMISLSFFLPDDGGEIAAICRVMWNRKVSEHFYENGVRFWDIEDAEMEKLNSFFDSQP